VTVVQGLWTTSKVRRSGEHRLVRVAGCFNITDPPPSRREAASVRLQRRVIRGCKSPRVRALGSETNGNCVAARRGGEQLEVNRWSAT
jgi:hypothetical protein